MLWIFEEAAGDGVAPLFTDGLISLLRQWLLRTGPWKLVAALVGGLLEVTAGGLGWLLFSQSRMTEHLAAPAPDAAQAQAMSTMIYVGMWAVTGVLLMVVFLVFWVKRLNARRLERLSAAY